MGLVPGLGSEMGLELRLDSGLGLERAAPSVPAFSVTKTSAEAKLGSVTPVKVLVDDVDPAVT